ncbi:uncharacterized protein LOC142339599 [Convolutriloba macropyga]|uniref:uncharacterized protein LOC142339599 n=1 Tax=Convolutriloba macropyga TaxID=536237 RepID=UPI003F523593
MANNLATVTNANMTFKNDTFNESRDGNDTGEGIDMARFENMFFTRTECKIVSAFLITCAILGSLLNFLVASVYIQKKSKCTYEIFILFLAFINLLGCCGVMCVDYWFVFSSYDSCREPPDFTTQLAMFMECASVLMLLNIAIDRYLSIRWAVHQLMTPRRAYVMCGCAIVIATSVACLPGIFHGDEKSMMKLHLYYPCVTGLVFVLICVLYMLVFYTVNQSAQKAKAKRQEANRLIHRTTAHYLDPGDASQNPSDNDRSSPLKSLRSALKKHSKGSNSTNSAPEKTGASPGAGETPKNSWNTVNASAASNNTGYFNDVYVGGAVEPHTPSPSQPEREPLAPQNSNRGGVTLHRGGSSKVVKLEEKKPIEIMRDRTVVILLFVFGTYAFCFIPLTILNFLFYVKTELFSDIGVYTARMYKSMQLLYYLNFVLTTFVYSILSHNFREDTVKFYRRLQLHKCCTLIGCEDRTSASAQLGADSEMTKSTKMSRLDRRDTNHSCVFTPGGNNNEVITTKTNTTNCPIKNSEV